MDTAQLKTIGDVVKRVPEWVRRDLTSDDAAARERAEETLAGMIAATLADGK